MFSPVYISELLQGHLSEDGYIDILNSIAALIRRHNWPKTLLVISDGIQKRYWTREEVEELTHQFFEWGLTKGKFTYLHKVTEAYRSYYFSTLVVSFVADKIKALQRQQGVSFEQVTRLVRETLEEKCYSNVIDGKTYWYLEAFDEKALKAAADVEYLNQFLSKIVLKGSIRHFKPHIEVAMMDVFYGIGAPLTAENLSKIVYNLFDQTCFTQSVADKETLDMLLERDKPAFQKIIEHLVEELSIDDVKLFRDYMFRSQGESSLAEVAKQYGINRKTAHYRFDQFRKKVFQSFKPENEEVGIEFLKSLSEALDKRLK